MSLLERYAIFHSKISLEFEITGFHDCNQWAHLLMILTKRGLNGIAPLFREIVIGFDTDNYPVYKMLDPASSIERHLILLGMQLCQWMYLKDVEVDFTSEPLSRRIVQPGLDFSARFGQSEEGKLEVADWTKQLSEKAYRLKSLTLVDSSVKGLSKILDAVGMASLEQLIIIYNDDCDIDEERTDEPRVLEELMEA